MTWTHTHLQPVFPGDEIILDSGVWYQYVDPTSLDSELTEVLHDVSYNVAIVVSCHSDDKIKRRYTMCHLTIIGVNGILIMLPLFYDINTKGVRCKKRVT